jgi:hypothetical protein
MSGRIDLSGLVINKLTVIKYIETRKKKTFWECLCACGSTAIIESYRIRSGLTKSCGCIPFSSFKHGGSGKRSYNSWKNMIARCTHPHTKNYIWYGAVGVKVCPEWLDYLTFEKDMGEPAEGETLDRIDPYGNYTKNNCRWANLTIQNRNIRVRKNSKSGHTGVSQRPSGNWIASITANYKSYYSKVFSTVEEAAQARKDLELKYWGVK